MEYSERMNQLMDQLNKSIDSVNKLDYFKRELLKVLDSKEKHEDVLSKSIQDYFNSINTTLFGIGIEKGKVGTIGEIRTWKDGKKYKKMPNGKWVRVYQSQNRSAEISIARLKGKVKNAQSVDELMNIVMNNIHRFEDENGNILPIVEELKKEVAASKGRINVGKPSTKEQIEKFKAEHKEKSISKKIALEIKEIESEYEKNTKLDLYSNDYEGLKKIRDKGNALLDKINDAIKKNDKDGNYGESSTLEDLKSDYFRTLSQMNWRLNIVERNYRKESFTKMIQDADLINITESDKQEIDKFQKEIDDFISKKEQMSYGLDNSVITFTQNITEPETCKKWMKLHDIRNFDEFYSYISTKISENIKAKKRLAEENEKNARNQKINDINKNNEKTFTDDEITNALKDIIPYTVERDVIIDELKKNKNEYAENNKKMQEREMELRGNINGPSIWDDEKYDELKKNGREIWKKGNEIREKIKILEEKINKVMDPIAYYYLNNFKYKKDEKINDCKTTAEVIDLIKSKDWYSEEGKNRIDLQSIDIEAAKDIFKVLEHTFAIFPEQKGKNFSIRTEYSNSRTWATGGTAITFNRRYWRNYNELNESYKATEGSFHPMGTTAKDIIYHEYYHVMTIGNLAKRIKENVSKNLKMRGKKGGPKINDVIKFGVSEYATKDANEFGAECFCQALGSQNPTAFAKEVFKETLKYKKYMRGLV